MGFLARLLGKSGRRQAKKEIYSVERSVTTLVRAGMKRRRTRSSTKEWRHGNCQVRHKSKAAATRCRNP